MLFQHFKILALLFASLFIIQCRKKSQSESAIVYNMNADAISQGRIFYVDHPGALLTTEEGITQFSQGTTDDSWLKDDLVWIVLNKEKYPDLAAESNLDGDISVAVRYSDLKFIDTPLALAAPRSDGLPRSGSEGVIRQDSTPDLRRTQSDPSIRQDNISYETTRNDSLGSSNKDLLSQDNSIRNISSAESSRSVLQPSIQVSFLDKASGFFKSIRSSIRAFFSNIGATFQNFLTRFSSRNNASANINDISDATANVARLQTTNQGTLVLSRPLRDDTRTSNNAITIRGQGNSEGSTPLNSFFLNPLQRQAIAAARVAYNSDLTVKRADVEAFWNIVALPKGSSLRLEDALPGLFNRTDEVKARIALPIIIEAATRIQQGLPPTADTTTTSRQLTEQKPTKSLTYAPLASRLQEVISAAPRAITVEGLNVRSGDAESTARLVEVIRPQGENSTPATDLARTFENTSSRENQSESLSPRDSEALEIRVFEDIKQGRKWPIKALASVAALSAATLAIVYASLPSDEDDQTTDISFIEDPINNITEEEPPTGDKADSDDNNDKNKDDESTGETGSSVIVEDEVKGNEEEATPEEEDDDEVAEIDSEESINDISLPSRDTEENVAASKANDKVIQVGEGVNSVTTEDAVGRTILIDANGILGFIAIRPAGAEQGAVDLSRAVQLKGRIQARDTGYSLGCSVGCLRLVPQE
ncbi:MAG: hypothetical protein AB8C84_09200 [Oligoflexales bacterium]